MLTRISALAFTLAAVGVILLAAAGRPAAAAPAAVFTVNSFVDQIDDLNTIGTCHALNMPPGTCTLRAAVMQANRTSGLGATIILPAGVYTLTIPSSPPDDETTGDLNLAAPSAGAPFIHIEGAGASSTIIDAGQQDRAFNIAANRTARISNLTVRNGFSAGGGGLRNSGTLTVLNVTLSGNSSSDGDAMYNDITATATLNNSTLSGNTATNGGGIFNYGTLVLNYVTLSANPASSGGGILNDGIATLNYSTLSGNSATSVGGGIDNFDVLTLNYSTLSGNTAGTDGGGIFNQSGLVLVNSTLSSNTANNNGGGIAAENGTVNVYNASILFNGTHPDTGSGGGGGAHIGSGATFNIRNTLLAGNYTSVDRIRGDCSGALHMYGDNLIGTVAGCTLDSSNYALLNSETLIGPLQNNGGPTWTHALLSGSNAIDAGDPVSGCLGPLDTLTTDQRGAPRPLDGDGDGVAICDIGAFEYRPPLFLPLIER